MSGSACAYVSYSSLCRFRHLRQDGAKRKTVPHATSAAADPALRKPRADVQCGRVPTLPPCRLAPLRAALRLDTLGRGAHPRVSDGRMRLNPNPNPNPTTNTPYPNPYSYPYPYPYP